MAKIDINSVEYKNWLDFEFKVRYSRSALNQVPANSIRGRKIAAGLIMNEKKLAELKAKIPMVK